MQSSKIVLYNLSKQAMKDGFKFDRLYRHLYNEDFYINAYTNIYKNKGSAIKEQIQAIITSVKDESYQPKAIPKTNGDASIPAFVDRLVQEVCRMILEAIYEPTFSRHSHSFRPNRSCHTALIEVKNTFMNVNWFVEGDITDFFTTINHHILINILRKRIKDEKLIRLMWKLLKAGFAENWRFQATYSQTPQGGILSPLLANIYLNEFDKYVENELKPTFDLEEPNAGAYQAMQYVRYADTFIIGVSGSKQSCDRLKQAMKTVLQDRLQLKLSDEKTRVTHCTKLAHFLSYAITVPQGKCKSKRHVQLLIPKGTIEKELVKNKLVKNIDAKQWDTLHRPRLVGLPDMKVIEIYNAELRGLYNYYALAENVSRKMGQLRYVMEYSCLKTFAHKYKSTVSKMKVKFKQGKYWGVTYETEQSEKIFYFYKDGFKQRKEVCQLEIDQLPKYDVYQGGNT